MISKKNDRFEKTFDSLGHRGVPRALPGVAAAGDLDEMKGRLQRPPAQMQAGHFPPSATSKSRREGEFSPPPRTQPRR